MPDTDLTRISAVSDDDASRLVSAAAFAQLASQIVATPLPPTMPPVTEQEPRPSWQARARRAARGPAQHWSLRRSLLTALPVAALAGAAALVIGLQVPATSNANSQAAIMAVSFVKANGHITVIIKNPYADSSWYNADFARHHLNIKLSLIASSPSFVGAIEYMGTDSGATSDEIKLINKPGGCGVDGNGCTIGFTIPADFHGQADMAIGRPARPGEQYQTTGSIFNKGEALAGLRSQVIGQPVSTVWRLLATHHLTIAVCRDANNHNVDPATVPAGNYVTDIAPWAPNQVIVWTGPTPASH